LLGSAPALLIAGIGAAIGLVMVVRLRPIDAHLHNATDRGAVRHLLHTASRPRYLVGFSATMLLATGGFMLTPFVSAFTVENLGVPLSKLPLVYAVTGFVSIVAGPLVGRVSDAWGKYTVFCVATLAALLIVIYYTNLGVTPLWEVVALNAILFVFLALADRDGAIRALAGGRWRAQLCDDGFRPRAGG
jgi:predicted MFS family arabinose efflux permease